MKNLWLENSLESVIESEELSEKKIKQLNEELLSNQIDISEIVESLGPALASKNNDLRKYSTGFLSKILSQLPSTYLNEKQLTFVSVFYADRLKDQHSIIPNVLVGILHISKMKHLNNEDCINLLRSLFVNVVCQSQVSTDRRNIFFIIKNVTESHYDELKKIGSEFVYAVIRCIEDERDPENLLFIFKFMPIFIRKFNIGKLCDDMFEIFECYFPIDYYPTKSDSPEITRDKLAADLSHCLCADDSFFDKCLDLIIEKIDSDLVIAKMDSLKLLLNFVKKFSIEKIENNFDKIWRILNYEIQQSNTNQEITKIVFEIINALLKSSKDNKLITENVLKIILNSVLLNLTEIEAKLYQTSINLLLVCLKSDDNIYAAIYLANNVLILFLQQLEIDEDLNNYKKVVQLLEIIENIWSICIQKNCYQEINETFINETQKYYLNYIDSDNLLIKQKAFDCIANNSKIISLNNRIIIYTKLNSILIQNLYVCDINLNDCIINFSSDYPAEVYENLIKCLTTIDFSINHLNSKKIYDIIISLLFNEFFRDYSVQFLFNQIFDLKNFVILNNLYSSFMSSNSSINKTELNIILYNKYNIIEKFINFIKINIDLKDEILIKISEILNIIVQSLSIDDQISLIECYLNSVNLNNKIEFYMTIGLLNNISGKIDLMKYLEKIINDLTEISITTNDTIIRQKCCIILCSLFNKIVDYTNVTLRNIIIRLKDEIEKNCNVNAVTVLAWITKGLHVKGDGTTTELIVDFLKLLDHPTLSSQAITSFEIISEENAGVQLPNKKLFYKQKLFQIFLKELVLKKDKHLEIHHLIVLSYIFKITPQSVLKLNLKEIDLILYRCLESNNIVAIETALFVLSQLIQEQNKYFEEKLHSLIPEFIKLAQYKKSMKIRISALETLTNLKSYPEILILPYKQDVVYGLLSVLDDPKRLVRTAAVKARNTWFLIGSEIEK